MKKLKNRNPEDPFCQGHGRMPLSGRTARRLLERELKKKKKKNHGQTSPK